MDNQPIGILLTEWHGKDALGSLHLADPVLLLWRILLAKSESKRRTANRARRPAWRRQDRCCAANGPAAKVSVRRVSAGRLSRLTQIRHLLEAGC